MKLSVKIFMMFSVFIFSVSAWAAAAELEVYVSPAFPSVGEVVKLTFKSSKGLPNLSSFPEIDSVEWLKNIQSQNELYDTSRGIKQFQKTYCFRPLKEGKFIIPSMSVSIGSKKIMSEPVEIDVQKSKKTVLKSGDKDKNIDIKDVFFCTAEIMNGKKDFYVGEEIPIEIKVYASMIKAEVSYPVINAENIVFKDFSAENPENPKFAPYRASEEKIDGRIFSIYSFKTVIRPISSGPLNLKIVESSNIIQQDERQRASSFFDDGDFFVSPFSSVRRIPHVLSTGIDNINIKPLPEPPENCISLGVLGSWKLETALRQENNKKIRVAEPLTLSLNLSGYGSLENLKLPELSIPDFRTYPPELKKSQRGNYSSADIKYVIIPVREASIDINLNFAIFNPSKGEYDIYHFDKKINVEKSELPVAQNSQIFIDSKRESIEQRAENNTQEKVRSGILYLKKNLNESVVLPLWKNAMPLMLSMFFLPLFLVFFNELLYFKRKRLNENPDYTRKLNALALRNSLLKKLNKVSDDELGTLLRSDLLKCINGLMLLPPGTSLSELSSKVEDKELAECLRCIGESSYMPGALKIDNATLKSRIASALKRFAVVSVFFLMGSIALPSLNADDNSDKALTAYDNGNFDAALSFYKSRYNPAAPQSAVLYNIGSCLCQKSDYPLALLCFEKAHLLAPADSDTLENLNFIRRKLMLPERSLISNPLDLVIYVRDFLRPDQWALFAASGWVFICLALILKRYMRSNRWIIPAVLGFLISSSALSLIIWQCETTYDSDRAMLMTRNAKLHSLPSDGSGLIDVRLLPGDELTIEDKRADWVQVKAGKVSGWLKKNELVRYWGDWKFL